MKRTQPTHRRRPACRRAPPVTDRLRQGRQLRRWRQRRTDHVDPQRRQQGRARRDQQDRRRLQRQPDQVQGQGPGLPAGLLQPVGGRRGGRRRSCPASSTSTAPNVPNWAWAGYLAPLEGMDDTLVEVPAQRRSASTTDKTYSYGYYDVALGDGHPQVDRSRSTASGSRPSTSPGPRMSSRRRWQKIKAAASTRTRSTSRPASPVSGGRTPTRRSCRASAAT